MNSIELETNSNRSDFLMNGETRTIRRLCESIDSGSQTTLSSSRLNDATDRGNDEDSAYAKSLKNILFIMGPWVDSGNNKYMDSYDTNNSDSNDYRDTEFMFPLSVSYLGENEEEEQRKELAGTFNYSVVYHVIIMTIFRKYAIQ